MTGDSRLHFGVLGAFPVERDGRELDLGPRLQRALLAILVVEARHVVPVDRLIDLLWRDDPPTAAMASVQAYISQLRRVLEPARPARAPARVLVTQDPGYLLRAEDDDVDALRFLALVRQAHDDLAGGQPAVAATRLEKATELWRGDPLPEFAGEAWAVPIVASLTEAHDLAAEDRVDAWLALGRHAQAVPELEAMAEARPLRERRWGQLIIAAYRCGRQADALRAYQRCRTAYQAFAAALGEATASAPLLGVVDDLHAADDASLALLQLLAGDLHRMPALLVFTVRDTEPSRSLSQALGELLRHPGAERVTVGAFESADVAALLGRLTGEPPHADVVSALMDRTGGNPFYTTELVRLVSSEQRHRPLTAGDVQALDVPSGIRDVLARRVGRLPDDTQSLLMVAAVAGRELHPELLERVTGLDPEQLLLHLEPAIAAGLVTTTGDGWGFRFRHPLIDESLRASMGRMERAGCMPGSRPHGKTWDWPGRPRTWPSSPTTTCPPAPSATRRRPSGMRARRPPGPIARAPGLTLSAILTRPSAPCPRCCPTPTPRAATCSSNSARRAGRPAHCGAQRLRGVDQPGRPHRRRRPHARRGGRVRRPAAVGGARMGRERHGPRGAAGTAA